VPRPSCALISARGFDAACFTPTLCAFLGRRARVQQPLQPLLAHTHQHRHSPARHDRCVAVVVWHTRSAQRHALARVACSRLQPWSRTHRPDMLCSAVLCVALLCVAVLSVGVQGRRRTTACRPASALASSTSAAGSRARTGDCVGAGRTRVGRQHNSCAVLNVALTWCHCCCYLQMPPYPPLHTPTARCSPPRTSSAGGASFTSGCSSTCAWHRTA
jgi:hypothetical protein